MYKTGYYKAALCNMHKYIYIYIYIYAQIFIIYVCMYTMMKQLFGILVGGGSWMTFLLILAFVAGYFLGERGKKKKSPKYSWVPPTLNHLSEFPANSNNSRGTVRTCKEECKLVLCVRSVSCSCYQINTTSINLFIRT